MLVLLNTEKDANRKDAQEGTYKNAADEMGPLLVRRMCSLFHRYSVYPNVAFTRAVYRVAVQRLVGTFSGFISRMILSIRNVDSISIQSRFLRFSPSPMCAPW